MKRVVHTDNAPKAIGPYSQAVWAGNLLFCSGQIPVDPVTNQLVTGSAAAQADRVLQNISAVLSSQGLGFSNVIKATIFLTNMNDFAVVNEVYGKYFKEPYPARSTVAAAALPKAVNVEIEIIAQKEG